MAKRCDPILVFDALHLKSNHPIFSIFQQSNHQFAPVIEQLL
jgi:hypothetical protein